MAGAVFQSEGMTLTTVSEFAASLAPKRPRLAGPPTFATVEDERLHRKQRLAAALRIFGKLGYSESLAGHITARDPELTDHFWVNPLGRAFSRISVSDLILVNHEGDVVYGDAPVNQAAFAIHSQIHAARPDVVSAAHSHSIHGKALSVLQQELLPITQDSLAFFEDNVVVPDFNGVVLDIEEGRRIARHLGANRAALLANHGLLTVGASVEEAVSLYVIAERAAEVQLLASAAGKVTFIDERVARHTHDQSKRAGFGWAGFQNLWEEIVYEQPDLLD
jgi:ribulose-5-phosphate 4-epimerase/fuculose-1-phosphate aldolase